MDRIIKCYALNKKILVTVAKTTDLVEYIRNLHDLTPTVSAALGRIATMSAIMTHTSVKENEDSLTIQINGNGPIGKIVCLTNLDKDCVEIRICAKNTKVELPLKNNGKIDVGKAIGNEGFLNIIKENKKNGMHYNGVVPLVTGEVAEDFVSYYANSEQKPSVISLGVLVNKDGIKSSGGYMINLMPDATEEDILALENNLKNIKPISKMLDENIELEDIAKKVSGDDNIEILENNLKVKYLCNCNKEKFRKGILSLGKQEITNIFEKQEKINVKCEFCNKEYEFNKTDFI